MDERRNHLVQKDFVAQFSALPPQSWEVARTAVGMGEMVLGAHLFCVIGLGTCSSPGGKGTSPVPLGYVKLILFGRAGYRMGKGCAGSEAGKEGWFRRGRMYAGKGLAKSKTVHGWGVNPVLRSRS